MRAFVLLAAGLVAVGSGWCVAVAVAVEPLEDLLASQHQMLEHLEVPYYHTHGLRSLSFK